MQLLDIGANLTHESFQPDLDVVLQRAQAHGVARMLVTGASHASSVAALALSSRHAGVLYATAGVHPHGAADYDDTTDTALRALAHDPLVRAIGETGLDYHRDRRATRNYSYSSGSCRSPSTWACRCFCTSATPTRTSCSC